ncbi:hypothetical protein [Microcoleus sp. MON1_C1]|uniref:hypothetical protein n=1 Tax=Microcoleus sp. MON1_C1 TaxID=2818827 RepID=UPI002FD4615B
MVWLQTGWGFCWPFAIGCRWKSDRKYAARSNVGLTFIKPVFTENKQQRNQASRKKPGFSSRE